MTIFPISIDSEATLLDAENLMSANGFRHLPVLRAGEPAGIISDRDLKLARSLPGVDLRVTRVEAVLRTELYAIPPDAFIGDVSGVMAERRIGSAVVVSKHKVVGIFTTTDALRALSEFSREASKIS